MTTWATSNDPLLQTVLVGTGATLPVWERIYGVNSKEHD